MLAYYNGVIKPLNDTLADALGVQKSGLAWGMQHLEEKLEEGRQLKHLDDEAVRTAYFAGLDIWVDYLKTRVHD